MKILKVIIKDKFDKLHTLNYKIYSTDLSEKWIQLTNENLKNPVHKIVSVFNNHTDKDIPKISEKIKELVDQINQEYDKSIESFDHLDKIKLNYLHQEFENFGERIEELAFKGILTPSLSENFFALNEYIHKCEDALISTPESCEAFGILYDIHPLGKHLPIEDEDRLFLETEVSWGKLYLGYNTLGKDWLTVARDNDIEVIKRGMVKSQKRFAAEAWLSFNQDILSIQRNIFFHEWVKTLPINLQEKIPFYKLNELGLGKFVIGEIIIDNNFLKYNPNPLNWKAYRHPSKLKWNYEVLSTFRSIESIRICDLKIR
jgi:hypothetical protein